MPLDRNASRILHLMAAAGTGQGPYELAAVRRAMHELARTLDPTRLPCVHVDDQILPAPGRELLLRRYLPVERRDIAGPALLYFHGGIGVFGSVQTHDAVCRMICGDAQMTVMSLEYRLAPEWPVAAGLDDAWFAARWVAQHAAELEVDPARLAVGGDSAGATLATVVCRLAREHGSPAIAAQLLLCPVTDLCAQTPSRSAYADGYFPAASLLRWALDLACPLGVDRRDPSLSPLRATDLSGLPPAHLHTAEYDPFRDEGAAYAAALAAAGVPVVHVCHPGLIHHFYGMAGVIPAARTALGDAAQEFRKALDAI
jgi:acetyl esterase/lipase